MTTRPLMVEFTYDPEKKWLYIELRKGVVFKSLYHVNDRVIIDIDEDGHVLAFEYDLMGLKPPQIDETVEETVEPLAKFAGGTE